MQTYTLLVLALIGLVVASLGTEKKVTAVATKTARKLRGAPEISRELKDEDEDEEEEGDEEEGDEEDGADEEEDGEEEGDEEEGDEEEDDDEDDDESASCADDSKWYKKKDKKKDCDWVGKNSKKVKKRCKKKGDDGTKAKESCKKTCGTC